MAATNVIYNSTDLNNIICSLQSCYGAMSYELAESELLGDRRIDCPVILQELLMYLWVLSSWQQNTNGSTTGYYNFVSQGQLVDIISRAQDICGCGC